MLYFGWEKEVVMILYSIPSLFKLSTLVSHSFYLMFVIWLILLYKKKRNELPLHLLGLVSTFLLVNIIKHTTAVPRPFEVYGITNSVMHFGSSFPSTHAALSSFMAASIALFWRGGKKGRNEGKRAVIAGFFLWALLISLSRWVLLLHYLVDVAVGWAIGTGIPLLFWIVMNERVSSEIVRKGIHIGVGYGVALVVFKYGSYVAPALLLIALVSIIVTALLKKNLLPRSILMLVGKAERREDLESFPLRGVVFFFLSSGIVSAVFSNEIAASAIAALAVGDGMATLIGRKWGKHKLKYNMRKSVEGTVACFLFSFLASLPILGVSLSIINGVVASIVESLPHREHTRLGLLLDDNFTIPLACCSVLYLTKIFISG